MSHLFLAPHNDDETLFGTFTLLRHQPFVVVCLRSFRMADASYPGGVKVEYAERAMETAMAMRTLGCLWQQWDFSDADPNWDHLHVKLEQLRDGRIEWTTVHAPEWETGGNDQHNTLAEIALEVFGVERMRSYLTYTASGKSRWGMEVSWEPEWIPIKHHALACYKSQAMHPLTRAHFLDDIREYTP